MRRFIYVKAVMVKYTATLVPFLVGLIFVMAAGPVTGAEANRIKIEKPKGVEIVTPVERIVLSVDKVLVFPARLVTQEPTAKTDGVVPRVTPLF